MTNDPLNLIASNRITPVFAISSVTGLGVDLLRSFVGEHANNLCCYLASCPHSTSNRDTVKNFSEN
jgi:hypothetical protein